MNLKKCVCISAVILVFGFVVQLAFGEFFLAALSVLILVGSLQSYFFETHYVLSSESVEVRGILGVQKKPWTTFKTFWVDRHGVSLSPFAKRSWLEHYRGMRLLFRGNRDQVVAYVAERLGKEAARGQRVAFVP